MQRCTDSGHCSCYGDHFGDRCEQLNECLTDQNNCGQNCLDQLTGFTCSCRDGYELDSNNRTCTGMWCDVVYGCQTTELAQRYVMWCCLWLSTSGTLKCYPMVIFVFLIRYQWMYDKQWRLWSYLCQSSGNVLMPMSRRLLPKNTRLQM